jgi:hypothetical protein
VRRFKTRLKPSHKAVELRFAWIPSAWLLKHSTSTLCCSEQESCHGARIMSGCLPTHKITPSICFSLVQILVFANEFQKQCYMITPGQNRRPRASILWRGGQGKDGASRTSYMMHPPPRWFETPQYMVMREGTVPLDSRLVAPTTRIVLHSNNVRSQWLSVCVRRVLRVSKVALDSPWSSMV